MESTIPQNSISAATCSGEASSEGGLGKQVVTQGSSRRSYGSTAMLGVAISVGACGLFAPRSGDAAIAADKISPEAMVAEPGSVANSEMTTVPTLAALSSSESTSSTSNISVTSGHTVQEGENLSQIAKTYGVSLQGIASLNQLEPTAVLRVGQVIVLRKQAELSSTATIPTLSAPANARVMVAKVNQDEAVAKLKEQQSKLKKGLAEWRSEESKLASVPVPSVALDASSPNFATHQVTSGESLSSIARVHGLSSAELASLNNIANPNLLKANQVLKVPSVKSVSARPETAKTIAFAAPNFNAETESDAPAPPMPGQAIESRRYIDGLMSDVVKARQKYQSSTVSYRPDVKVATESVSMPAPSMPQVVPTVRRVVNPEAQVPSFTPKAVPLRSTRSVPQLSAPTMPRVIARASLGADSYAPLVQPSARRLVSPEMPTIGASDAYLPKGKGNGGVANMVWPAQGVFTSGYGPRWGRMHRGIDIAAPVGTPIVSSAPGVVSYAGYNDGGFGYLVEVDHADGSMTRYAHNDRILVSVGQQVEQGQQIAEMGSTGRSTGPHLHFEIHPNGNGAANPMAYLPNNRG